MKLQLLIKTHKMQNTDKWYLRSSWNAVHIHFDNMLEYGTNKS